MNTDRQIANGVLQELFEELRAGATFENVMLAAAARMELRWMELDAARPTVVCLCGSTRFWRAFQRASLAETMAGRIVLSIGAATGTDDEHFGNLPREEYDRIKAELDELHKRKIDLCDEILVLNVGGYVGSSTQSELDYARAHGKRVRWLEEPVDASV